MVSYIKEGRTGPRGAAVGPALVSARQLFVAGAQTGNNMSAGPTAVSSDAVCTALNQAPTPGLLDHQGNGSISGSASSLASLLVAFDDSWLGVPWTSLWCGKAWMRLLEMELMRMAVPLERSMRVKLGRREVGSPEVAANPNLQ